jgi:hypothetical protein
MNERQARKGGFVFLSVAIALCVVTLLVTVPVLTGPALAVGSHVAEIPQSWATLIAAILGFGAVTLSTRLGFRNLIRSQINQATLDRQAAADRASADRDARVHQADLARRARIETRAEERRELAAALSGEIVSIHRQFANRLIWLDVQRRIYGEFVRTRAVPIAGFEIPPIVTPVYNANIPKIGLLGPSLSSDVAEVFGLAGVEISLAPSAVIPEMMVTLIEGMLGSAPAQGDDMVHVNARLMSVFTDSEDPGSLFQTREQRARARSALVESAATPPVIPTA